MRADILIVGQGLAGTCLGWELERAKIPFTIVDSVAVPSATSIAAGIINPITGRRLVKSWRIGDFLPVAREVYQEIGAALGVPVWRDLRVRRQFADDGERAAFVARYARGELAPFVVDADDEGFWIRDAACVQLRPLLAELRSRWEAQGCWCGEQVDIVRETERRALVIDCRGAATVTDGTFDFVPWEFSKGEILELAVDGLAPDVVINRRHWVLPVTPGVAWLGATHVPGAVDASTTAAGRATLEASAAELLQRPFTVTGQRAGLRVNLPDKRPVAGPHPTQPRLGILNGLGAKGVVTAPWLARVWVNYLRTGTAIDPAVNVGRFGAARM